MPMELCELKILGEFLQLPFLCRVVRRLPVMTRRSGTLAGTLDAQRSLAVWRLQVEFPFDQPVAWAAGRRQFLRF